MKHETVLKITTGAMFVAIFTILLLINRYSGSMFETIIMYLLPIPMVAYSAKFGFKSGLPVLAAMVCMSFIFGTFTTIFYAGTESFIGLVFGSRIHRKADMTMTIALVMILSVVANVLNMIVLASLFGYDLVQVVQEMQDLMNEAFDTLAAMPSMAANADQIAAMKAQFTTNTLTRIYIISQICAGAVQGYLVYAISLMILNRLRFKLPKPRKIIEFYPPKWTGFLAVLLFLSSALMNLPSASSEAAQATIQTIAMCGYLYLVIFGVPAVLLIFRRYLPKARFLAVIVAFLGFMCFPQILMVLGIMYISSELHERWMIEMYGCKYLTGPEAEAAAKERAEAAAAAAAKAAERRANGGSLTRRANLGSMAEAGSTVENTGDIAATSAGPAGQSAQKPARKYNGNNYRSTTAKKSMRDKSMLVTTLLEQSEDHKTEDK